MKKLIVIFIILFAQSSFANDFKSGAASVEYVSNYLARQGCNITNTAQNTDGANMEYLLKTIDMCNGGATSYGVGTYSTNDAANITGVNWAANYLLNDSQYVSDGLILNLTNIPNNDNTTVWTDISGNNNHATLYGNPIQSDDNGMVFSAYPVVQYARTTNTMPFSQYNAITVEVRFTILDMSKLRVLYTVGSGWWPNSGGCTGSFGLAVNHQGSGYKRNVFHSNSNCGTSALYWAVNFDDLKSHTLSQTYFSVSNPNGVQVYSDGQLLTCNASLGINSTCKTSAYFPFYDTNFYVIIGGDAFSAPLEINSVRVYNRQLTAAEVCQNAWLDYQHFGGKIPDC